MPFLRSTIRMASFFIKIFLQPQEQSDSNAIVEKYHQNEILFYKKLSTFSGKGSRTIPNPFSRSMVKMTTL
jgi:hypothetical protein